MPVQRRLSRPIALTAIAGAFVSAWVLAADFIGTPGPDVLEGTPDADTLDGKGGADTMMGLGGDDLYIVNQADDVVIEGAGEGIDTIRSAVTYTLPIFVENLVLTGVNAINGKGNDLNNRITGNGASNVLNGGTGNDRMIGKDGNDTYIVNAAGDIVSERVDEGVDTVRSTVSHTLRLNVERLFLIGVAATNGKGNDLNNLLIGNLAANVLTGGTGRDTLIGNDGDDRLLGEDGNDKLTGGPGLDTFVFDAPLNATSNVDAVTDFTPVDDVIELSSTAFTTLYTAGTLPASAFRAAATAASTTDRILYDPTTGILRFDADGTGATASIQFATLAAGLAVNSDDFFVIDPASVGRLTTRFGDNSDSYARSILVQPDGKIVVAGVASNGAAFNDFALARYNSDGSLDASFSADGLVTTNISGRIASTDWARGVALQGDGKIVVAGYTTVSGSNAYGLAVARYNTNGSLDSGFSVDGIVTMYDPAGVRNMFGHAIVIQQDGKLLVAGAINCFDRYTPGYCTLLTRFNTDGSIDTTFASLGGDSSTLGAAGVVLQTDGKILVAGTKDNGNGEEFSVARYKTDGNPDTSFANNGVATVAINSEVGSKDFGMGIALQSDGKIIVAGQGSTLRENNHFAVARFLADGDVDLGFGSAGVVLTNISGGAESDYAWSVSVQSDGKILLAGDSSTIRSDPHPFPGFYSAANIDFTVVRYNSDGSLDTSFSNDGIVTTDFRLLTDTAYCMALQPNGSILVAGESFTYDPNDPVSGGYTSFAVARYKTDGSLDQTFNGASN